MSFVKETVSSAKVIASLIPVVFRAVASRPSGDEVDNIGLRLAGTAARYPDKTAVIFEGESISWGELDRRASQVAHFLHDRGVEPGDCVSLLMENRIEFLALFFGIVRAGAIASLINTNLRGLQLVHCITTTRAKTLIFGGELTEAVAEVKGDCNLTEAEDFLWVADGDSGIQPNWAVNFDALVKGSDPMPENVVPATIRKDPAIYIFTSGTTGLPKASIQKHNRLISGMDAGSNIGIKIVADDCIHICLPLYHATGLMVGFGPALHAGATVFLRRKFSASHFLEDVREHGCNTFLYIGELCRYLLAQPEKPDDSDNPLVKMTGNGLRPDIWMTFKNRFGIERIVEFYGASEGNTGFINLFNRDCTVGTTIIPPSLIEYDVGSDTIVRDAAGWCKRVAKGEPGLLLGPITAASEFEGYTDKEATEKKILRNVFKEGDAYFNTGDLVKAVDAGFAFGMKHYQFVDRVGDTFRWKGENCSTNEVGEIINQHPSVQICNVYGVEIAGTDGRAGMAAIVLHEGQTFDSEAMSALIVRDLASYARPIFLRILQELPLTGTFKLQKGDLREAAYHPDKCSDEVYVLKPGRDRYEMLDEVYYEQIISGQTGY